MTPETFVSGLEADKDRRLRHIVAAGRAALGASPGAAAASTEALLEVALANEISVSELAAAWMPTTPEIDVKIAFARQAGDEARHFQLVADRLAALGFDAARFQAPAPNPLFEWLRALPTSIERVAAGLFTLESIAWSVNDEFMRWCAARGDDATVRLYRDFIQPDEEAHQRLGRDLLARYATTEAEQEKARAAVVRTIELAGALRARAAARLGTAAFPGC